MNYYAGQPHKRLVERRVELNAIKRQATIGRNAVPNYGDTAPLKFWRRQFVRPFESVIRRCNRELAEITKLIGPPAKCFRRRNCPGYEKIARQYKAHLTPLFAYAQAIVDLDNARMELERSASKAA